MVFLKCLNVTVLVISSESSGCECVWVLWSADEQGDRSEGKGSQTETKHKITDTLARCTISTPGVLQTDTRCHYPGVGNDGSAAVAVTADPLKSC